MKKGIGDCFLVNWIKIYLDRSGIKHTRELHKKDDPILLDGHPARPFIISGLFVPHHKKFLGIFLIGILLS